MRPEHTHRASDSGFHVETSGAATAPASMWLIDFPQRNQSSSRTEIRPGELLHEPSLLFVFVGFSDDRRFAIVVWFGAVFFVLVIIIIIVIVIVGISWRHRVAHDGDESPLGPGKILRVRPETSGRIA